MADSFITEFSRENTEVLLSGDLIESFLSSVPFAPGSDYVNEQWLKILWSKLNVCFSEEIQNYSGTVALYLAEKDEHLKVAERIFFHLVEIVQGSGKKLYTVKVRIDELTEEQYEKIVEKCALKIQNLEDLINGNFPDDLKSLFTEKRAGLFPSMAKIHFNCSCPDWADMCKHVAAVLYGIGSRFDRLIWNGSVNCCGKWVKDNSAVRLFYADSGLSLQ